MGLANDYNIIRFRVQKKRLMKPTTQQPTSTIPADTKSYSIWQWILISVRLVLIAIVMCCVNIFHEWIRPRIIIPFIRRYLSCVVNLFYIRLVLLILGFFKFQCENYRYFDKMSRMMTFKSGWVGVASQKSIVQFLYYSYLFNPTYVRVVQYHEDSKIKDVNSQVKLFYTPLTFREAFLASLQKRGFDPIVIKGQAQLKRFKRRKMKMPTLISECFQQLNGPVLIFLPIIDHKEQLKTHKALGQDIYDNQKRFLRSGVIFVSEIEQFQTFKSQQRNIATFSTQTNREPLEYLIQICSQVKMNILTITATQTIKHKYEYDRDGYCEFVDETYEKAGYKLIKMEYEEYLNKSRTADEQAKDKQEQQEVQINRQVIEKEEKEDQLIKMMEQSQELIKNSMIQKKILLLQEEDELLHIKGD